MCLVAIAYKVHPKYPLLMIGNRDEFYERPTERANWWQDHPNVFAGRDLKAGGTWMGINTQGQFAVLTNFRLGRSYVPDALSRGELVSKFLIESPNPQVYLQSIHQQASSYNLFNILIGNGEQLFYFSNAGDRPMKELKAGIYGLSNSFLDVPWPKLKKATKGMKDSLENPEFHPRDLFGILMDKELAPDEQLPDTKIPYEWEKKLSAMFIEMPNYGTRVTTLIRMDKNGQLSLEERAYFPKEDENPIQISHML